jgi:hypothetical protein
MSSELREFVRDALARGMPRPEIREKLVAAGWRPEEADTALGSFAEIESPVPVPRRRPYLSAREAFFYLVLFVTLYITAINVGTVLFQLVDRAVPEVAGGVSSGGRLSAASARGAVAAILIAFPIFLFMSRLIGAAIARDPEKRASKIRKWLTYITLFVSACVIIGDLTFLVTQVLSGELVLRIGLKVLAVFLIAGVIFVHYLSDLRREEDRAQLLPSGPSGLARAAGVGVLATLLAGLFLAGSPRHERLRRIDGERVENLVRISSGIRDYYRERGALPASLAHVADLPSGSVGPIRDPVTGEPYGYRIVDSTTYELGARFDTVDSTLDRSGAPSGESRFWRHGAGPTTYRITLPPRSAGPPAAVAPAPPRAGR